MAEDKKTRLELEEQKRIADEVREGDTILIDTEGDKLTARVK